MLYGEITSDGQNRKTGQVECWYNSHSLPWDMFGATTSGVVSC
jgi:hypothetical protein